MRDNHDRCWKHKLRVYSFYRHQSILQVEVIGGADMYQAVCRDCFKSPVKKSPRKSPCKSSPYKTPEISSQKSMPLADLTNRQLFISPQKN